MAWSSLDTRAWNLGALALGIGGCGPVVPLPADTDGDTQPDDDDDTPSPDTTETTPTPTTTVPGGCDPPCAPGYSCVEGTCYYDCNSCCDGECGGYYECFAHEDCGGGEYCNYYSCAVIPYLYNCPGGFAFVGELIPEVGGAISLVFADTDGDAYDDLATQASNNEDAGWLVRGPDAGEILGQLFPGLDGIAATDVDGASPTELTFALGGDDALLVMNFASNMPFELGMSDPALDRILGADLDGDGLDDVAGVRDGSIAAVFSNGSSFDEFTDFGFVTASTIAAGELGPTAGADLAWADGFMYVGEVFPGGGSSVVLEEQYGFATRTPIVGDFDGDGVDNVAAIAPDLGDYYGVIATWNNLGGGAFARNPYVVGPELDLADGVYAHAVADFDNDGADDVAIGGVDELMILFGSPGGGGTFACWVEIKIDGTARHLAAGDFDGNAHADVAWSDGLETTHILLSG